jgi:hypothetical protein
MQITITLSTELAEALNNAAADCGMKSIRRYAQEVLEAKAAELRQKEKEHTWVKA